MKTGKILLFIFFLFLFNNNPVFAVTGMGMADLTSYPVDVAQEIALRNALGDAAKKASKIKVSGETIISMGITERSYTKISYSALVKSYTILKKKRVGNNYYVAIKADEIESTSSFIKKNLSDYNVIVLHKGDGSKMVFDKFCEDLLNTNGIKIYTAESLKNYLPGQDIQLLKRAEIPHKSDKFLSLLANSVIVIETFFRDSTEKLYADSIKSFHGRCSIKRLRFNNNKYDQLESQVSKTVTAWGANKEDVLKEDNSDSFYGNLTDDEGGNIIEDFRNEFLESIKKNSRKITIKIQNIHNRKKFNKYISWLKKLPYIDEETVSTSFVSSEGKGKIKVDYTDKTVFLASMLDRVKGLEVINYDYLTISLAYKGKADDRL